MGSRYARTQVVRLWDTTQHWKRCISIQKKSFSQHWKMTFIWIFRAELLKRTMYILKSRQLKK